MTSIFLRPRRSFCLLLITVLSLPAGASAFQFDGQAASLPDLPRLEKHTPHAFNQIMRENALFFNMLVTFGFTLAVADPAWDLNVKNINLNLITRAVRDPQGRQFVRVRVAGVVRKNNNVELDILNEKGLLVGKGFLGYPSGQITFFDTNNRAIVNGFMDSRGDFLLDDLRLPQGKRDLSSGFVDPCFYCTYLSYGWWDALNVQIGGGRIYPYFGSDRNRIRVVWTFDRGRLNDNQSAAGGAEYDLSGETTGAINSVLFDTGRTPESFFANPYSLVPEPAGKAFVPRFSDFTGIAVTNLSSREAEITYIARRFDGSLISGPGIENPVTYRFAPSQQFTAFPGDIFRGLNRQDRGPILKKDETGWIEIFSDDADVQAMFLDADSAGTALDGNVGAEKGSDPVVFPDLRLGPGESTEIELLNLAFDDVMVRLELLDREGNLLREEREFYIAGYGTRAFHLGESSSFLRVPDASRAATLRVSCNNQNSIKSSSCSRLIGLATYQDSFNSLASALAASADSAGPTVVGAHFATGQAGPGTWETVVKVAKLGGTPSQVFLDLYDGKGTKLHTVEQRVVPGGQAEFALNPSTLPWGNRPTSGYIRVSAESGSIVGTVSLRWADGRGSMTSTYPLSNRLSTVLHFNQVAQGASAGVEYWTGIAVVNDLEKPVRVNVKVIREDGVVDRTAEITLQPYQQFTGVLSQLFNDSRYTRLNGYITLTASDPVSGILLYGDSANQFLSAVPGIYR